MGLISELGPIDPQMNGIPALALGNAFEFVTELASRYPGAESFLSKYVASEAPLNILGYFKRVSESAQQYAERLLGGRSVGEGMTPEKVADRLVNHYKDHSFVIDVDEALNLLGPTIVRQGSAEYDLADELFELLDLARFVCERNGLSFWLVGASDEADWRERTKEQ